MTVVELDFAAVGHALPADHGYALFSALSEVVPSIHEATWLGIHTLPGIRDGKGNLTLPPKPKLSLRLPMEWIPTVYPLAGKKIVVGNHPLRLGIPQIRMLTPAETLRARLVTLKLAGSEGKVAEPVSFLEGVQRQLETLGIGGRASLEPATDSKGLDSYARRVLRIKGTVITGYGVLISGLNDEDSLKLQAAGIGGRRRMGCGIFVPVNKA
ncbi:MAG: type I-MYXAN CRISPR-associated protein Cas6/Cmx6 [Aphanocapsa lilacina HA4352-LM1]|jgi:CRISPR-associated endonuclease/helicase Cas3|nr:type I-MYXAN CRISPR-associated protein Cas6/Cmx6 [Aphanocapsa lilacina HA4352-LM1]